MFDLPFSYTANPSRVVFGSGTITQLPAELERLGLSKPLLLTTAQQVSQGDRLEEILGGQERVAGRFGEAVMHTPTGVTEKALAYAKDVGADCVVSIGGGSTIGLGKAISVRTGLMHICIPTTYAGSEMTPILGETENGEKKTRTDPKILPGVVIYDVDLTMTLPVSMSCTSGINAVAHAVEAIYAKAGNPIISLLAVEGIRSITSALPTLVTSPSDKDARSKALYGAWLCGVCLGSVGMAFHHKLCHTLGGSFDLPHAETHTAVLPHALAYNLPSLTPPQIRALASSLSLPDTDTATPEQIIDALNKLYDDLPVERGVQRFGMKEEEVDKAVDIAFRNQYWNPRGLEREGVREVVRRVTAGERARVDL
ncbi:putative maleylacetate reductase [Saitoella complicata NRRL Y-17804]|uniref:Uncharacterized protein n=1 Tax=Saitoella complicata (strain BCRC 22490 / CBS 7301 / JCM 7358 / NBRC 10748 / NRRL Y-17804) TaxID=698492 RepID=A0A0E9NSG9_SAICN|nr:putative maleylacetate reductase [Saitoella complicata NRRL Y-17804]ODQ56294.1 putative maleylacetate reductase [Saitoella complicata NRRL Y-17804]GAO52847.1 hypothetical protein G7K_6913-t1 [Saitoella complicata NRRL Y-17804]